MPALARLGAVEPIGKRAQASRNETRDDLIQAATAEDADEPWQTRSQDRGCWAALEAQLTARVPRAVAAQVAEAPRWPHMRANAEDEWT